MLMAIGDLFNVSHCLPSCVKNSHTKNDSEPSCHVIFGIISALRNGWNRPVYPSIEERNVVCHHCPPGSCVCHVAISNLVLCIVRSGCNLCLMPVLLLGTDVFENDEHICQKHLPHFQLPCGFLSERLTCYHPSFNVLK